MHIFYIPQISSQTITLPENESKHCIRVLRMGKGDSISIVDGKGGFFTCCIIEPNPKRCTVEVTSAHLEFGKRNFHLHIAIAPTKSIDRFEWFLEKATEIGIDEITPMLCEHSERKTINVERIERVTIAAMKQSVKAYLPTINPITHFDKIVKSPSEQKLIAYCGNFDEPHSKYTITKGQEILFLIGPEGDFSPSEVTLAKANGFRTVGLGSSRLRTETAGVVACTVANLINDN